MAVGNQMVPLSMVRESPHQKDIDLNKFTTGELCLYGRELVNELNVKWVSFFIFGWKSLIFYFQNLSSLVNAQKSDGTEDVESGRESQRVGRSLSVQFGENEWDTVGNFRSFCSLNHDFQSKNDISDWKISKNPEIWKFLRWKWRFRWIFDNFTH